MTTLQVDVEPGWRGGQRQVYLLCTGLVRRGHTVVAVVRRGGELGRRLCDAGIETVEVSGRNEADPGSLAALIHLLRTRRPAILAPHSGRSHGLAALADALTRTPAALVPTRRVLFPPHRDPFTRWKYRRTAGIIAISSAVASALSEAGIPAGRIRVVHSGVTPPDIPPDSRNAIRSELGIDPGAPLVGAIGALTPEKGHRDLLAAFRSVAADRADAVLIIAGDGPDRASLESDARTLPPDRVRFLGHRDDVPRILGALDLLVMPSRSEGLGTTVVDAQMAGLPVVATRTGGLPELVEDGVTGLLVPPADPPSLASAIARLLRNPDLSARLGQTGRERALQRFSDDAMVEGTLAAYREFTRPPG